MWEQQEQLVILVLRAKLKQPKAQRLLVALVVPLFIAGMGRVVSVKLFRRVVAPVLAVLVILALLITGNTNEFIYPNKRW
jgi:hypothetical protein